MGECVRHKVEIINHQCPVCKGIKAVVKAGREAKRLEAGRKYDINYFYKYGDDLYVILHGDDNYHKERFSFIKTEDAIENFPVEGILSASNIIGSCVDYYKDCIEKLEKDGWKISNVTIKKGKTKVSIFKEEYGHFVTDASGFANCDPDNYFIKEIGKAIAISRIMKGICSDE